MNKKPIKMQDITERLRRQLRPPQQPRRPVLLEAMRIRRLMGMRPRGRGGVSWRPTEIKMPQVLRGAERAQRFQAPPVELPKPPESRFPFGGQK